MKVSKTALYLIARMKRDWMQVIYIYILITGKLTLSLYHLLQQLKKKNLYHLQTGRKPSGLCGAALYISALSHGYSFSKTDIVSPTYLLLLL